MNKNIPKLRFNEFDDEWQTKKLEEVAENGFNNGVFNDPNKVGQGYKLINVKDMYIDTFIDTKSLTLIDIEEKEFLKNKVFFGDIFFTRSSLVKDGIAKSNIFLDNDSNTTYDGHLIKMTPKHDLFYPIFLHYNFKNGKVRQRFIERGKTTTMTTIGQEDISKIPISFPTLPEQEKIAEFLMVVDEKLEKMKEKKQYWEQYKKGIMQKIFSQEIRFKDDNGNNYPDWHEKRLGEICNCLDYKRKPLNETIRQNIKGVYPYWGANNIMDYINDYIFDETIVLLAEDGGNFNDFKNMPIANISHGKCWVNNHTHVIKGINNLLTDEFLFYSLVHKDITGYVSGGTRSKLIKSEMLKIIIHLPSYNEQTKIADFLSSIDEKIEQINIEILEISNWKKGLLQQMFV